MKRVSFVNPQKTASISLTGRACSLDCAHCGGHFLSGMKDVEALLLPPKAGKSSGLQPTSVLVSGGCDRNGQVPLWEHREKLSELSKRYRFIAHTGLILDKERIDALSPLFQAVSFDLLGDDGTVEDVYGLDASASDFFASYRMLSNYLPTYPHITLGIRSGEFSGEYESLEAVAKTPPPALVVNIFIPTPNTRYADCLPPSLDEVKDFLEKARSRLGKIPIYLGCMRPSGKYRASVDCLALDMGLARIVKPHQDAKRKAMSEGFKVEHRLECCIL